MWSHGIHLMNSVYGFREEDELSLGGGALSQKDRATLKRLKCGVSELRTDLESSKADVGSLRSELDIYRRESQTFIEETTGSLTTLNTEVTTFIDESQIFRDEVRESINEAVCGEAADDDTAVKVILDDFTITKSKGDLFKFMRRGNDYHAIHVLRSAKLRVSIVISLAIRFTPGARR